MTNEEKRAAVLKSAAEVVEKKKLGGRQAHLTLKLAAVVNKFLEKNNVKLEMTCLILDTLTEQMCVAVFDDAEADGRIERVAQVTLQ